MARTTYRVYVDESGIRSHSPKSSDHFVMSAVMLPNSQEPRARAMLAGLRSDFKMPAGTVLSFKDLPHAKRVHISKTVAAQPYIGITNVVVCKRLFARPETDVDLAYLYTLRFALERISWYIDTKGGKAYVTFAHIKGFKIAKLLSYVNKLQAMGTGTEIRWDALYLPVRMDTVATIECLQIADTAASATGQAFHTDEFGNVEPRYLMTIRRRLYRHPTGPITSYGMKLHPTSAVTDPRYEWVAKL
jgi:hypothetical protein